MSTAAPPQRKVTRVAVGVLIRSDGFVLLADRPAGKPYAGYWEFPGGKIEHGEDVAAALERELHEELGVDIGPSVPWVTFEFDYPHAYVELQFRVVREWRGDPHSREGQRLGFFDPALAPPRPLLPAAVPTLRWLLLPRTVLVTDLQDLRALCASVQDPRWAGWNGGAPMVVADADWRGAGAENVLADLRAELATRRPLLLASGPGALRLAGADGVVTEADAIAQTAIEASGTRGSWAGRAEELRTASALGCDFVLVRSVVLAEQLRRHPAPLPAYLPSASVLPSETGSSACPGHGRWLDLRSPASRCY
jgi:8-oxo-dGTP diphosphatase